LTIDERMIKFTGRLGFKQYIKGKKNPYGIKAFLLADATNSYIYNIEIYTGNNGNQNRSLNSSNRTVKSLLEGTAYKGHTLYMDNFFCSIPLFKDLQKLCIGCSGTVRKNRKYLPSDIKEPGEMNIHDTKISKSGNIVALVYIGKRPVHFLTNFQGEFTRTTRQTRNGEEIVVKPSAIVDYNKYKLGVDKSDQYASYYFTQVSQMVEKDIYKSNRNNPLELFYYL